MARRATIFQTPPPPSEGLKDRLGPRELAWLLERVADFGPEDPPWRKGPPVWRPQAQPPRLQLLVPETVVLDAESRLPSSIFFTDAGGFLRGMRRPVRKDPGTFFEAIMQLMRSRQEREREYDPCKEDDCPSSSPSSSLQLAPPRSARRTKYGTLAKSIARGSWRLIFGNGTEESLSDQDVQQRLAGDACRSRWPAGSRLLQATFWLDGTDGSRCLGVRESATYHYEALQGQAVGNNQEALSQIMTNHFERFRHLDCVVDRARISALPVLLSQHLSYQCGLELVSGDFKFEHDCNGQLWLTDAKELFFIYSSSNRLNPPGAEGAGEQPPPLKMFRYLSEEALNSMPIEEETGQKCRHMLELMRDHYGEMKQWYDVDSLLKRREEVLEVSIPVLEGMDFKALVQTFGLGSASSPVRSARGDRCASRRRYPVTPKAPGTVKPKELARWAERRAAASSAASTVPLGRRQGLPAGVREVQRRPTGCVTRVQTPDCNSLPTTPGSRTGSGALRLSEGHFRRSENIEIVSTSEAERLVIGSGPGARPKGPTLDTIVSGRVVTVGGGLEEKREAERPTPRLVEVPPGAAVAVLMAGRNASSQGHAEPARGRVPSKHQPAALLAESGPTAAMERPGAQAAEASSPNPCSWH